MNNFISVIVCTYNRERYIGKCLEHLHNQHADKKLYEIIIIDNNSTDGTTEICKAAVTKYGETTFHYFFEPVQGHSQSRNRGISESKGNIIAFLDDDAFTDPDYISNLNTFFIAHPEVMAIGGKIIPVYEGETPAWMSEHLLPLVAAQDMGNQPKKFTGRKFPIGANMAFRKEAFDKYGIFNTNLGRKGSGLEGGDEKDVFDRLKKNNETIFYVPSVIVQHIIPQKRVELSYIRGLGIGVGTSERKRIQESGKVLNKVFEELYKIAGTGILILWYFLQGRFSAGIMLVRFRCWVIKGLFLKQ
ncbi:MAG: glycosyltransferase family 2 protein [Cyclobacteriaceae bacterium]|nr:glycosyltransferase family 2 protein [Cyclobacteriaceae bacterium]